MRKMLVFTLLAGLLLSTASWAEAGTLAAGLSLNSLYNIGGTPGTYCLGGQLKIGVTDNIDLDGRAYFGDSAGPGLVTGLGIFHFDIGSEYFDPYVGIGVSYIDVYTDSLTDLTRGQKYFGWVGSLGLNCLLLGTRLPLFIEMQFASYGGKPWLSGTAVGVSYVFR